MAARRAGRRRAGTALAFHRGRRSDVWPGAGTHGHPMEFSRRTARGEANRRCAPALHGRALDNPEFLAAEHATIADLACYSYVAACARGRHCHSANTRRCSRGCAASKPCRTSSPSRPRPCRRTPEAAVDGSPFNPDELAAQALAGGGPRGGAGIRDFMPEQHRHFFAQLPYVFVGAVDSAGWPLATLLTGPPGFVQSPDPFTLHIAALPDAGDPAARGARRRIGEIGILGIDFSTRRRNRANGRIVEPRRGRHHGRRQPELRQLSSIYSAANARRSLGAWMRPSAASKPAESFDPSGCGGASRHRDEPTLSSSPAAREPGSGHGVRGGYLASRRPPGFRRGDATAMCLTIPDFRGNRYFNTLGQSDRRTARLTAVCRFRDRRSAATSRHGTSRMEWRSGGAICRRRAAVAFPCRARLAAQGCLAAAMVFRGLFAHHHATGVWRGANGTLTQGPLLRALSIPPHQLVERGAARRELLERDAVQRSLRRCD